METIGEVCLNDGAFGGCGTGETQVMRWKCVNWELLAGIRKTSTFKTELLVLHFFKKKKSASARL